MEKKVMVVDDDPLVRNTIKKILLVAGFNVVAAEDGKECLDMLKEGFKGLILMDVMMPEMDGWDTVKVMVEKGYIEGNIICMLTARESPDIKMEHLKEYVLDYITKPFENKKLVSLVNDYLSYIK